MKDEKESVLIYPQLFSQPPDPMVCVMHKKWLPRLGPKLLAPPPGRCRMPRHTEVWVTCSPRLWGGWMAKSIWDPSPSEAGGHRMARGYTRVNVVYHFFEVRDRTPCQDSLPVCLRHPVIHLCRQHKVHLQRTCKWRSTESMQ